jgi:hypothetical protein
LVARGMAGALVSVALEPAVVLALEVLATELGAVFLALEIA